MKSFALVRVDHQIEEYEFEIRSRYYYPVGECSLIVLLIMPESP